LNQAEKIKYLLENQNYELKQNLKQFQTQNKEPEIRITVPNFVENHEL